MIVQGLPAHGLREIGQMKGKRPIDCAVPRCLIMRLQKCSSLMRTIQALYYGFFHPGRIESEKARGMLLQKRRPYSPEVFRKVMEQVENFEENS